MEEELIYCGYETYGCEGCSPPFYVGKSLEKLLRSVPNSGSSWVWQKWVNGELSETVRN